MNMYKQQEIYFISMCEVTIILKDKKEIALKAELALAEWLSG